MRSKLATVLSLSLIALVSACGDDVGDDSSSTTINPSGDGDATGSQSGDGDGETMSAETGDGDATGDGDGDTSMIEIPAGSFLMGCDPALDAGGGCLPDREPAHEVTLDAFEIDRTEVRLGDYLNCLDAGDCPSRGSQCVDCRRRGRRRRGNGVRTSYTKA